MKHAYFLALLALGLLAAPAAAQAQLSGGDSLRQQLATLFAPLDKSQVPTGYLYEAGIRLLEPRFYNGVLGDSNLTDLSVLRYLRAGLGSARVYGTDTLPSLDAYNARVRTAEAAAGGAVPLTVQYVPYATIRPDALQNNLLTARQQLEVTR